VIALLNKKGPTEKKKSLQAKQKRTMDLWGHRRLGGPGLVHQGKRHAELTHQRENKGTSKKGNRATNLEKRMQIKQAKKKGPGGQSTTDYPKSETCQKKERRKKKKKK